MSEESRRMVSRSWWTAILTDPHFWTPVVVLLGGLIVLRWIQ
jgi:hypothetical protein